ncbi:MAG: hypothetical protein VB980_02255 [Opitutales bacterium]|jgi:hypothetical protein
MNEDNTGISAAELREKMRRARAKVRAQLVDERKRLHELEMSCRQGMDNTADVEASKGQIEVLKKELLSIEEGGHTTFVSAKKGMEPKQGYSDHNRSNNEDRTEHRNRLAELEARLETPGLSPEDYEAIRAEMAEVKEALAELAQERKALKEFNHTRFMAFRKETVDSQRQEDDLLEIDQKIVVAQTARAAAEESGDPAGIEATRRNLHLLLMEKQSIENFTHDLFLQNLERMKARRENDLD